MVVLPILSPKISNSRGTMHARTFLTLLASLIEGREAMLKARPTFSFALEEGERFLFDPTGSVKI